MVIKSDPEYEKQKALEEKLNKSDEERKTGLIEQLKQEPLVVLSLAYSYAKGFELGGIDVTTAWNNTARQTDALNQAYQKGFKEGMEWLKKQIEKEQTKQQLEQWKRSRKR